LPISMPCGYEFESCEMVRMHDVPTACLRYSDGVAVVTVFETPCHDRTASNGSIVGQVLPRGESLALCRRGGINCVVVGPRKLDGIMMIARSLDIQQERVLLTSLARRFNYRETDLVSIRNRGLGIDCM